MKKISYLIDEKNSSWPVVTFYTDNELKIIYKGKRHHYFDIPAKFVVNKIEDLKNKKHLDKFKLLNNFLNSIESYKAQTKTAQKIEFNHVYLPVSSLKKSIEFYEKLIGIKPKNIEGDRWADYHKDNRPFLGLKNKKYLSNKSSVNTVVFHTTKIEELFEKIKDKYNIVEKLKKDRNIKNYDYQFFKLKDLDGNIITICQYKKNKYAMKYRHIKGNMGMLSYVDIAHHGNYPVTLWYYDVRNKSFQKKTVGKGDHHSNHWDMTSPYIYQGRYDPRKNEASLVTYRPIDSIPDELFESIKNEFGFDITLYIFEI